MFCLGIWRSCCRVFARNIQALFKHPVETALLKWISYGFVGKAKKGPLEKGASPG